MRLAVAIAAAAGGAAAAGQWEQLFTPPLFTDNPIPIMMGVDCKAKGDCFVAGGTPNTGFSVYKIRDEYFRDVQRLHVNNPVPLNMLLSVAMRDSTHAVTAGLGLLIGGTFYTVDGLNFNTSLSVGILTTQDVKELRRGWARPGFAYVGQKGKQMGPAVSHTGGALFTGHWWPEDLAPESPARYGAFPSESTWYVTGGRWPSDNDDVEGYHYLTQNVRVDRGTGQMEALPRRVGAKGDGYTGVITKTSDGGKTWVAQYHATGWYFNQIDCWTETVCTAVGEASDGPGAGAHIMMTTDGRTWKEVLVFGADARGSVMTVKMLSEREVWVAAGVIHGLLDRGAVMLHTTDGGQTWEQSPTLSGIGAITALTFIDDDTAYACGVTFAQTSTVVCMGCGAPPAPSPGTGSFKQVQCSDANCTVGCRAGDFPQGQCIATTSGGSANVTCSADGTELDTQTYTSADCSGEARVSTEPTGQCLRSSSGGYFENVCPPPSGGAARAADAPLPKSAALRTR